MADRLDKVIEHNERTVVYFYRPGCPYCDYIEPHIQQLQDQYADVVTFTSVDISDQADLIKEKYDFETVPMVMYFLHGKLVARHGSRDMSVAYKDMQNIIEDVFDLQNHSK